jgi:hypothetical protein
VAETVGERQSPTLKFSKDSLDGIPISILFSLKSEPSSGQRSLEVLGAIDQTYDGFDIVFVTKLSEKDLG